MTNFLSTEARHILCFSPTATQWLIGATLCGALNSKSAERKLNGIQKQPGPQEHWEGPSNMGVEQKSAIKNEQIRIGKKSRYNHPEGVQFRSQISFPFAMPFCSVSTGWTINYQREENETMHRVFGLKKDNLYIQTQPHTWKVENN